MLLSIRRHFLKSRSIRRLSAVVCLSASTLVRITNYLGLNFCIRQEETKEGEEKVEEKVEAKEPEAAEAEAKPAEAASTPTEAAAPVEAAPALPVEAPPGESKG